MKPWTQQEALVCSSAIQNPVPTAATDLSYMWQRMVAIVSVGTREVHARFRRYTRARGRTAAGATRAMMGERKRRDRRSGGAADEPPYAPGLARQRVRLTFRRWREPTVPLLLRRAAAGRISHYVSH